MCQSVWEPASFSVVQSGCAADPNTGRTTGDLKTANDQMAGAHDIDHVLAGIGASEHDAFTFCSTYYNRLCARFLMAHPQFEIRRRLHVGPFMEGRFVSGLQK